jgi:hypothetical protein
MSGKGLKETIWGWCAVKSVYPFKEGPGQVFPPNVARVEDPAMPAKPHIVQRGQVVEGCSKYVKRTALLSKADLMNKLSQQGGNVRKK